MSTIASVKQADTWEGLAPTVILAKFIEFGLATFEGSFGYGGTEANNPIEAAKNWAMSNEADSDIHGFYVEVIDTQATPESAGHKRQIYPRQLEENNFRVTWES